MASKSKGDSKKSANTAKSDTVKPVKKRASSKAPKKVASFLEPNSNGLLRTVQTIPPSNRAALNKVIRSGGYHAVDLAPTYLSLFKKNKSEACRLAECYAESIADPLHHRELFQQAAGMDAEARCTLISGYRRAGQARGVVHAIGQLPRAQGRTLMRDLVVAEKDTIDRGALREVMFYLRDAGAEITRMQKGQPPKPEGTDAAVVDFFEDVADEIANAITDLARVFRTQSQAAFRCSWSNSVGVRYPSVECLRCRL